MHGTQSVQGTTPSTFNVVMCYIVSSPHPDQDSVIITVISQMRKLNHKEKIPQAAWLQTQPGWHQNSHIFPHTSLPPHAAQLRVISDEQNVVSCM